jgi:hypothetical protein
VHWNSYTCLPFQTCSWLQWGHAAFHSVRTDGYTEHRNICMLLCNKSHANTPNKTAFWSLLTLHGYDFG